MRLPIWLYERREGPPGAGHWRWGSRKLGLCLMRLDYDPGFIPVAWLGCIWRLNFMFGPEQGVEEGLGHVGPARIFYRRRRPDRTFGVAWHTGGKLHG